MKTPSEISSEGREEFNQFIDKIFSRGHVPDYAMDIKATIKGKYKADISSQEVKMLEGVKEWGRVMSEKYIVDCMLGKVPKVIPYDKALSDLQSFLSEEIKKIQSESHEYGK